MNVAAEPYAAIEGERPRLLKLAGLLLRNGEWAERAVEQTLRAAREAAGGPATGAALTGILKDRIADRLRLRRGEVVAAARREAGGADPLDALFGADGRRAAPVRDWGDSPAASSNGEFMATLQSCIEDLPPSLATVLLLREWMQYDTGALCRALGLSEAECLARLLRARLLLGECLQRRWFDARLS